MSHGENFEPDSRPGRGDAGGENGDSALPGAFEKISQGNTPKTVHDAGLAEHQPTPERSSTEDRLVALIRQEVRQEVTQFYFEAQPQLHTPEALEGYKRVAPDIPDRIVTMAEREQKAQIDSDLLPIRAEAYAYRFAVTVISIFPVVLIFAGIALVFMGNDVAGYLTGVVATMSVTVQIITQVKPSLWGRSRNEHTRRDKTD